MAELLFPLHGIARHRMGSDGCGVTTLVAAQGCPLRCRLCLNPQAMCEDRPVQAVAPGELYERLKVDDLYFRATGGGVTFGGGEPLLHARFIRAFREICGSAWRLTAESCLNIPEAEMETAMECLDAFIVDIKDTDPEVYRRYTGRDNAAVLRNLRRLLEVRGPDCVLVRVPHIPAYNGEEQIRRSLELLRSMGVEQLDRFNYILPEGRKAGK